MSLRFWLADQTNVAALLWVLMLPADETFYMFLATYPTPPEYQYLPSWYVGFGKLFAAFMAMIFNFFIVRWFLRNRGGIL